MRGSPAPSSASSSASDLSRSPAHSRSDLRPGTSGDYSLSASLSACTLLSEVQLRAYRVAALSMSLEALAPRVLGQPLPHRDLSALTLLIYEDRVAIYFILCGLEEAVSGWRLGMLDGSCSQCCAQDLGGRAEDGTWLPAPVEAQCSFALGNRGQS